MSKLNIEYGKFHLFLGSELCQALISKLVNNVPNVITACPVTDRQFLDGCGNAVTCTTHLYTMPELMGGYTAEGLATVIANQMARSIKWKLSRVYLHGYTLYDSLNPHHTNGIAVSFAVQDASSHAGMIDVHGDGKFKVVYTNEHGIVEQVDILNAPSISDVVDSITIPDNLTVSVTRYKS